MKNPIVELMEERLVGHGGLSPSDAEYVAAEVKKWIEDPDAKPSKSFYGEDKLVVTGSNDGRLVLTVNGSTNLPGISKSDPQGIQIHFPEIFVHHGN